MSEEFPMKQGLRSTLLVVWNKLHYLVVVCVASLVGLALSVALIAGANIGEGAILSTLQVAQVVSFVVCVVTSATLFFALLAAAQGIAVENFFSEERNKESE